LSPSDDIPRIVPIFDGRSTGRSNRKTAGTKEKCIFCGTKTYRYIGGKPVCSQCDREHRAELEKRWNPSMAV